MTKQATNLLAELDANVEALYSNAKSYDDFRAANLAIWKQIETDRDVNAEISAALLNRIRSGHDA